MIAFLRRLALVLVLAGLPLAAAVAPGYAVNPDEMLKDPALEARAREISKELRCLVCQNESIDDSNADLAKDLRLLVRKRIVAGDTNKQVIDFVVSRYGEFVLLRPRFETKTLLLWGFPFVVLFLGAGFLWSARRRRPATPSSRPLSPEEEKALSKVLDE